LQIIRALR